MRMSRSLPLYAAAAFMAAPGAAMATQLSVVSVSAPAINCVFETDCTIVVTDSVANIPIPNLTSGVARLQSRTFTGKQSILNDLHGHVRSLLVERARTIAHRFIADGDHVVVEAKGNNLTKAGERYDNDYCLVFRLENGMIKEIREYCDSVLTEKALGPFPQAPVRAAS